MATKEVKVRSKPKSNWKHLPTLRERMAYLFDNPLMSDLVFICKHNQRFFGHKLIVTSGSQVLDDLIHHRSGYAAANAPPANHSDKWRVNYEDGRTTVEVPECDVKHMKALIKFLYTDHLDICDTNAGDIIFWSKKFKIRCVTDRAVEYIATKLNGLNCLQWWQRLTANELVAEESDLINRCLHLIAMNAKTRFSELLFTELSIDQLISLFSRNDLNINEFDLFKAAIHWANMKCKRKGLDVRVDQNLRQALGLAFDLIRFPIMSSYEFGLIITQYRNIFTREEINSLIAYINSGVVIGHRLPFESKPRIPICSEQQVTHNDPYYGQWRQPLCSANHHTDYHYWLNQQTLCQPRTPLGYPPMYGTSFMPMSPPYTPSPQPMLTMTTLSTPLSPPCPPVETKNDGQPKRRTYASVVITDPKTGQNLDLKKLAQNGEIPEMMYTQDYKEFKECAQEVPKQYSPQSTSSLVSVSELEEITDKLPEDTEEAAKPSVNNTPIAGTSQCWADLNETYISDDEEGAKASQPTHA